MKISQELQEVMGDLSEVGKEERAIRAKAMTDLSALQGRINRTMIELKQNKPVRSMSKFIGLVQDIQGKDWFDFFT